MQRNILCSIVFALVTGAACAAPVIPQPGTALDVQVSKDGADHWYSVAPDSKTDTNGRILAVVINGKLYPVKATRHTLDGHSLVVSREQGTDDDSAKAAPALAVREAQR